MCVEGDKFIFIATSFRPLSGYIRRNMIKVGRCAEIFFEMPYLTKGSITERILGSSGIENNFFSFIKVLEIYK